MIASPKFRIGCSTLLKLPVTFRVSLIFLLPFLLASGCNSASKPVDSKTTGPPDIQWERSITVADGPGIVGPWRMNRSNWNYVDDPSVDMTADLQSGVAWVNQGKKDIYFQLFDPENNATFDEPANVSGTPEVFSWFPDVELDFSRDQRNVYILWQEIVFSGGSHGGEIFFARSVNGGRNFESPLNLSKSEAGDGKGRLKKKRWDNGSLDLELGPDGRIFAAWTEYEGRLWFSYSKDSGQNFSEPVLVYNSNNKPARGPSIATGLNGNVYLTWTVGGTDSADIHLQKLNSRGRSFRKPQIIHPNQKHSDVPKIEVSKKGILHLVWVDSPGGIGGAYQLRYTRRVGTDTNFEEPQKLSHESSESFDNFHYPSLELDDSGNPYILWELFPEKGHRRSKGLGLIRSVDRGNSFEKPGIIKQTLKSSGGFNGSLQGKLFEKIDVENDGDLAVVNSTFKPDVSSQVKLFRGKVNR